MGNAIACISLLTRKKTILSRAIGVLPRGLTPSDLFVLGCSASIGVSAYEVYKTFEKYGAICVVGFPLVGLLHLIPVWCYSEIASRKPCMGGPYHYAYHFQSEVTAFFIGWTFMLCLLAGVSHKLKYISSLIDQIFFNRNLSSKETSLVPLPDIPMLDHSVDLLAVIIAFILAGLMSLKDSESKRYIQICFFTCLVLLTILIQLNIGFGSFSTSFCHVHLDRPDLLFNSYMPCAQNYIYVYLITFLGEETLDPATALPSTMLRLFAFNWVWFTIYPSIILVNAPETELNKFGVRSFLQRANLEQLHIVLLIGVISGSLCSVFMLMMSLERLIIAMSRDGLLFEFFVKAAHSSGNYIAPSFTIGLLSGVFAMLADDDALEELFSVSNIIAAVLGPVFVLKSRYHWSVDFVWDFNAYENAIITDLKKTICPILIISITLTACVSSFFLKDAKSYREMYVILSSNKILLSSFGGVTLLSLIVVFLLRRNDIRTPYKVIGVPLVPVVSLFFVAFVVPLIHTTAYFMLSGWTILGLFLYIFYSIANSREDL